MAIQTVSSMSQVRVVITQGGGRIVAGPSASSSPSRKCPNRASGLMFREPGYQAVCPARKGPLVSLSNGQCSSEGLPTVHCCLHDFGSGSDRQCFMLQKDAFNLFQAAWWRGLCGGSISGQSVLSCSGQKPTSCTI